MRRLCALWHAPGAGQPTFAAPLALGDRRTQQDPWGSILIGLLVVAATAPIVGAQGPPIDARQIALAPDDFPSEYSATRNDRQPTFDGMRLQGPPNSAGALRQTPEIGHSVGVYKSPEEIDEWLPNFVALHRENPLFEHLDTSGIGEWSVAFRASLAPPTPDLLEYTRIVWIGRRGLVVFRLDVRTRPDDPILDYSRDLFALVDERAQQALSQAAGRPGAGPSGRVVEMCGDGPVPWESTCNIEPQLVAGYLRIEQVQDLGFYRDRISAMVRDRHVTVEWEAQETDLTHLGRFNARSRQVLIPRAIAREPDRVKAAIMAHELWHAVYAVRGYRRELSPSERCLDNEREAFQTGLVFYDRMTRITAEPLVPLSRTDGYLFDLMFRWADRGSGPDGLRSLADEHVVQQGYHDRCGALSG